MSGSLDGKVAAITGGASGIGLECARAMIAQGAVVHLLDRDEAMLAAARDALGPQAVPVPVDLFDYPGVEAAVERIATERGRIDVFHANAGSYVGGNVWEGDPARWETMVDLNVTATFRAVRAALLPMMRQQNGDVVVTSSVAGVVPVHVEPIYTASKHAVQAFVHSVRRQMIPHGVRVGAVLPGPVHTPLLKDWDPERLKQEIGRGALLEAKEVAEAVVFMVSRPKGVTIRDLVILPQVFDM
ncbi:MAG: SDR family oxidoreductase [Gluconacetobacter diazotrophicus]|nr:SDR family oxidoreductase [Gluconacetobacter diazotrophicus]